MPRVDVAQDEASVPIALDQHTFTTLPIFETGPGNMDSTKSIFEPLEPELPILRSIAHAGIEAQPGIEHAPRRHATGLADVAKKMLEWGIAARGIHKIGNTKLVDVRIGPAPRRLAPPQRIE